MKHYCFRKVVKDFKASSYQFISYEVINSVSKCSDVNRPEINRSFFKRGKRALRNLCDTMVENASLRRSCLETSVLMFPFWSSIFKSILKHFDYILSYYQDLETNERTWHLKELQEKRHSLENKAHKCTGIWDNVRRNVSAYRAVIQSIRQWNVHNWSKVNCLKCGCLLDR